MSDAILPLRYAIHVLNTHGGLFRARFAALTAPPRPGEVPEWEGTAASIADVEADAQRPSTRGCARRSSRASRSCDRGCT